MKLIKTVGALGLMGLAAATSPVSAADDSNEPRWYGGGSIGQSRAKIHDARITSQLRGQGLTTTSIDHDDRDVGFKIFGGRKFNRNFAVEAGYFNLGKVGFTAHTTPPGTLMGSAKFQGANVDAVGILPITDKFSAFGRMGLTYMQTKDSFSGTGFAATSFSNASPKHNGANVKFGLGVQYDFTPSLAMRGEWERYRVNDAVGNKGDIDMLLVGVVYTFGAEEKRAPRAETPPPVYPVAAAPVKAAEPVLVIVPVATQQYCSILDIQYEINSNTVQREAEEKADTLAIFMRKYPKTTAVIEGHTDEVGSAADNMKLSERRAENMVTYLVDHGKIARSRLKAVGYGETRPIADNRTEAGKRLNRRINALVACATDIEGIPAVPERVTMALEMEFDQNSAVIRPQYREELRKVANFMKANPKVTAAVEGHTGNLQATKQLAMEISQKRAQNVTNYLVTEFGVERSRLTAEGFGQTRRFAYNTSVEGRQENRRVNIVLDFPDQK